VQCRCKYVDCIYTYCIQMYVIYSLYLQYACMSSTRVICIYAMHISQYTYHIYTYCVYMCTADMHTAVCILHICSMHVCNAHTGWRRLIGSPKLQIIFHKRATKYRSLLRKMSYKDKGSYESWPPCNTFFTFAVCMHAHCIHRLCILFLALGFRL